MPTLQFKGKNIIWNHHLAVPFHTLDEVPELHCNPEKANGNMIIEGDNLLALKALLPQFAGKIKCIYIDPPYNTGNENWVYNDKVNSPLINEWIGKQVGIDDLTRHDKWLCMISPRLKLLRDLLSDDGAIFISIDDNENSNLKIICDEIYGEKNFVGIFTVNSTPNARDYGHIGKMHEYCYFYSKDIEKLTTNFIEDGERNFAFHDDKGGFNIHPLYNSNVAFTPQNRPNLYYPFYLYLDEKLENIGDMFYKIGFEKKPNSIEIFPPLSIKDNVQFVWRWGKDLSKINMNIEIVGYKTNEGEYRIVQKMRNTGKIIRSILSDKTYTSRRGTKEVEEIFEDKTFSFPKPLNLIKQFLLCSTNKDSIILDSFAGSGTTMHAVMDLNKEDGGNRKCIMVQMTEATEAEPDKNICKDITRERVKRAIDKYGYDSGFKYYRLGIPLDAETMLAGQLPTYKQFAKYVYYLCTGENLEAEDKINEADYYVGEYGKQAIYLVYKQDYETLTRLALNLTLAEKIKQQQPGKKRIVYAPSCFLDEEYLTDNQIEYVGIPYNLFQRNQ
ncbi:MAG: site-specific DNA-methyltransferase [Paludibacteraceae bacterium]|nr:site-specific DNA-methyltransferase [Paludibacteraceae bacterium]